MMSLAFYSQWQGYTEAFAPVLLFSYFSILINIMTIFSWSKNVQDVWIHLHGILPLLQRGTTFVTFLEKQDPQKGFYF